MNLKQETKRRTELLKDANIDVEGFGLLNTFFLYDSIYDGLGKYSRWLANKGFNKLALWLSDINTFQWYDKTLKIRQFVRIEYPNGHYEQEGWIHDKEPEKDKQYILDKYKLSEV